MAEWFRVDPEALDDAVRRLAELGRYAETMVAQLDSVVADLHGAWAGEAAEAHAAAHLRWARGEAAMREALSRLTSAGAAAHANYIGAMATNLDMWS